jgi:nucleotide-binding universal stress UspA family protein
VDYSELLFSFGGFAGPMVVNFPAADEEKLIKENIARFDEFCTQNQIAYSVHQRSSLHVMEQIKLETRYADLLLLSGKTFYENLGNEIREDYLENVLHRAECPVIMLPETCPVPRNIVIAFDGSSSSVFAVKQFAYLFPAFRRVPALVVHVSHHVADIPDHTWIDEWMRSHFEHAEFMKLETGSQLEFEKWLESRGATMLVAGAFSRGLISEWIRKSFIATVLRQQKVPVFMTHK